jgi:uncharacterized membrane protein
MNTTIEEYLNTLKAAMSGADPAVIQDAQADAREHLSMALADAREADPGLNEAEALQKLIDEYGSPEETAAAYKEVERRTSPALKRSVESKSTMGRFFGIYTDPRAWGSVLFMLIALVTGILYFTWAITGLSLSITLSIFIFGLPLAFLFILSVRGLSLMEGRIVEALLGERMPRRPVLGTPGLSWFQRLKEMVTDRHTWFSLLYMILQMPLGVLYFSLLVTLLALGLGLMAAPIIQPIWGTPIANLGSGPIFLPYWGLVLLAIGGFLLLTLTMHMSRGIGWLHGRFAKWMLVS